MILQIIVLISKSTHNLPLKGHSDIFTHWTIHYIDGHSSLSMLPTAVKLKSYLYFFTPCKKVINPPIFWFITLPLTITTSLFAVRCRDLVLVQVNTYLRRMVEPLWHTNERPGVIFFTGMQARRRPKIDQASKRQERTPPKWINRMKYKVRTTGKSFRAKVFSAEMNRRLFIQLRRQNSYFRVNVDESLGTFVGENKSEGYLIFYPKRLLR